MADANVIPDKLLRYDASRLHPALLSRAVVEKELTDWSEPVQVKAEVRADGLVELMFRKLNVVDGRF